MRYITTALLTVLAILVSLPASADWPMLQYGPEHTGYTPSPGPDTLNVLWEWEYETPNEVYFYANSVVTADGRVYAIINEWWWIDFYSTGVNGQLVCLDASSGDELWRFEAPYDREIEGYPTVDHGRVYLTVTTTPSYGGYEPISKLYCLDAVTGDTIWTWDPRVLESNMGPPVVAEGVLYITEIYGYYWGFDYDCSLYALDAATGGLLWGVTVEGRNNEFIQPSIHQGRVYTGWQHPGSSEGALFCLDALTGATIWSRSMVPHSDTAPTVAGDKVLYHLYGDVLAALDVDTGSTQWEQSGSGVHASAAVAGNRVFNVNSNGLVSCFDLDTGEVQWTASPPNAHFYVEPSVAGNRLYASSRISSSPDNYLYCFDTETGDQLWSPLSTPIKGCSPAVAEGKIYISDDQDGLVLCIGREATVEAQLTCSPQHGPLPFDATVDLSLTNLITDAPRQFYYRLDMTLPDGSFNSPWRQGWQNVMAGETWSTSWAHNVPALEGNWGQLTIDLDALDVTPAPWNQPPYLPAGYTTSASCASETRLVNASLICEPSTGTLPFASQFEVSLENQYTDQARQFQFDIAVTLANGQHYTNWRFGWQNVMKGQTHSQSWWQTIPAYGTLIGTNLFELSVLDVTPAPYNQPPYSPAGDTATDQCTITASEAP